MAAGSTPKRRWWQPRWTDTLGLAGLVGYAVQVYRDSDNLVLMGGSVFLATFSTMAPRVRDAVLERLDPRRRFLDQLDKDPPS